MLISVRTRGNGATMGLAVLSRPRCVIYVVVAIPSAAAACAVGLVDKYPALTSAAGGAGVGASYDSCVYVAFGSRRPFAIAGGDRLA